MTPATFYADLAEGPAGAEAWCVTAPDGVGLRVAAWPGGDRGTVLIFPGRNEHVEKYGRTATVLAGHGYAAAAIDWRGQGLADRTPGTGGAGHVTDFAEFQRDVRAYVDALRAAGYPEPFQAICHSMGGAIGLRALHEGLPVKSVAFSAPMWGIVMSAMMRPVAAVLSAASRRAGFDRSPVPVGARESYLLVTEFIENQLTHDSGMYDYMVAQVRTDPRLALGRPTLGWLHAALTEMRALAEFPAPPVPVYTAIAGEEMIVDNRAIRQLVAHWPDARIEEYEGARHEIMMELPPVRTRFLETATALFDEAGRSA